MVMCFGGVLWCCPVVVCFSVLLCALVCFGVLWLCALIVCLGGVLWWFHRNCPCLSLHAHFCK